MYSSFVVARLTSARRSLFISLILTVFIFSTSGCRWAPGQSLSFGEDNPPQGEVQIDLSKFSCLREIDARINDYFNSNLSEQQVSQIMTCVRSAIRRFQYLTKGSSDGSYPSESLSSFLNKEYLSDKNQLHPNLVSEIMKIKVLALGGDEYKISMSELNEFIEMIGVFEQQAISNLPYIKIYKLAIERGVNQVSQTDLLSARNQLRLTSRALARILMSHKKVYSLADLRGLIEESRHFLNWEKFHENSYTTDQIIDLVKSYKEITTSNGSNLIRDEDWMPIADTAAVLYGNYLNYKIRIENHSMMFGAPLETLIDSIEEALDLVESIVKNNPDKTIPLKATDHLFQSLEGVNLLPFGVKAESLSAVYRHLIAVGFQKRSGEQDAVIGLNTRVIGELRNEFSLWAKAQRYLSRRSTERFIPTLQVVDPDSIMIRNLVNTFDFSKSTRPTSPVFGDNEENLEINSLIKQLRPMFRVDDERVFIAHPSELSTHRVQHNIYNLTRMNVMRVLVRLLIRTFAMDEKRIEEMSGVTENEMVEFYRVVRPLGVDLNFMDPRKVDSGQKIFSEGNIFTFSGDGVNPSAKNNSQYFTFNEIIEYLSLMWSGGQFRNMFYETIAQKCSDDGVKFGPKDVFGKPKINRTCFLSHIDDNNLGEFSNLPNMLNYIQADPRRVPDVLSALEEIALIPNEDINYIELSEIATMSTVMHYVEVLYSVYDLNQDSILDEFEIMKSYPRFSGYLQRQIQILKNDDFEAPFMKSIFLFLLKYQELPVLKDAPTLYWWKYRFFSTEDAARGRYKNLPEIRLDRMSLIQVLKVLTRSNEVQD